jgi:hypothetical protein
MRVHKLNWTGVRSFRSEDLRIDLKQYVHALLRSTCKGDQRRRLRNLYMEVLLNCSRSVKRTRQMTGTSAHFIILEGGGRDSEDEAGRVAEVRQAHHGLYANVEVNARLKNEVPLSNGLHEKVGK